MLHVVMQQHVFCLGYVSFVLVICSLTGLVLYRTQRKHNLNKTHAAALLRAT